MKKSIFALLLLIVFSYCNKHDEIELSNPLVLKDGLLYKDSSSVTPYTGRHKSKMLDMKIEYEVKNGIRNGNFIIYNAKDKIQIMGNMNNNKNEGNWKYYYPDGSLESEGLFVNDTVNGLWKWYYPSGQLMQEGMFKNGLKEGEWKKYDSVGQIEVVFIYKKNELVDSILGK